MCALEEESQEKIECLENKLDMSPIWWKCFWSTRYSCI